ncbi:hypothetical protein QUF90_24145 [Desulfococcaceae bacterium HSG9]|nr:hypothetical protein [Desulfococcaceae bacterium HSG9]
MQKNYCNFVSLKLKRMGKFVAFLAVTGVIAMGTCGPLYGLNPDESAVQLFKDRALLVLRDSFRKIGTHYSTNPKSHLTVFNKTMKTLRIELTGKNGTHPLVLQPKTKYSWRIYPGNYHFEAGIPGFQTAAGKIPLRAKTQYIWQIWRGELKNFSNRPASAPAIRNQPQVVIIKKPTMWEFEDKQHITHH